MQRRSPGSFLPSWPALAVALCIVPLAAQKPLRADDVELQFVRPQHVELASLYQMVRDLYGRELVFEDGRRTSNVMLGNGALLLNEEKDRMPELLATIAKLDVAIGPDHNDFTISVFEPRHGDVRVLGNLAMRLLNRTIPAASGGTQNSISVTNERIVVRELPEAIGGVLEKLAVLDHALSAKGDDAPVESVEYTPRSLTAQSAMQALGPFTQHRTGQQPTIMHMINERGALILQGRSSDLVAALELLRRVDRPAPQVMLSAYVLTGSDEADGNASAEVADALRELLPYRSYSVQGASVVRVAAQPTSQFNIDLAGPKRGMQPTTYHLQGSIAAYDPDAPSLTFQHLSATVSGGAGAQQLFRTATTIYGDEYAVLGVAGGVPTFVVLRLKPVRSRAVPAAADAAAVRKPN